MRNFLTATALLWPVLTKALAFPSPSSSQTSDDSHHISTASGSTTPREVSVRFETPCQGCFVGTDDGLVFDLTIQRAKTECASILPLVNGVPLRGSWKQNRGRGHGVLQTKLVNGLGEREIYASWETLCIAEQAQLLSFTVHNIGQDKVKEPSGFTASFKQQGQPEILRLIGEPVDLEPQDARLFDSWVTPPTSLRLSVVDPEPDPNIDQILEDQFRQLADLHAKSRELQAAIHDKKIEIKHIVHKDFMSTIGSCPGIKCVVQTAFQKVPKLIQLIINHFHHGPPSSSGIRKQGDPSLSRVDFANETRSLGEDHEDFDVNLYSVPQPTSHSEHDELDGAPTSPSPGDSSPPTPGSQPPAPPFPPPPPPGHGRHGFHHPPPPPPFPPHHRHHRHPPQILKRIVFIIVLATLVSLLFRHLRHNTNLFRCCPRKGDRACRREERRNRRADRRAALRQKWSTLWNRYRRPAGTADYEEKRTLILEQEGVLEDAMQDELRALRTAHQIVEEMYDAEEGRSRLYRAVNQPRGALASSVELPATGPNSSGGGERRNSASSSMYSLPPPLYEEELDGDLTVVDGFQYTPSSSSVDDDNNTPDSSVIDCSPRMSYDTGRIMVTRGDDGD